MFRFGSIHVWGLFVVWETYNNHAPHAARPAEDAHDMRIQDRQRRHRSYPCTEEKEQRWWAQNIRYAKCHKQIEERQEKRNGRKEVRRMSTVRQPHTYMLYTMLQPARCTHIHTAPCSINETMVIYAAVAHIQKMKKRRERRWRKYMNGNIFRHIRLPEI